MRTLAKIVKINFFTILKMNERLTTLWEWLRHKIRLCHNKNSELSGIFIFPISNHSLPSITIPLKISIITATVTEKTRTLAGNGESKMGLEFHKMALSQWIVTIWPGSYLEKPYSEGFCLLDLTQRSLNGKSSSPKAFVENTQLQLFNNTDVYGSNTNWSKEAGL